jgi:hypothetical protein
MTAFAAELLPAYRIMTKNYEITDSESANDNVQHLHDYGTHEYLLLS